MNIVGVAGKSVSTIDLELVTVRVTCANGRFGAMRADLCRSTEDYDGTRNRSIGNSRPDRFDWQLHTARAAIPSLRMAENLMERSDINKGRDGLQGRIRCDDRLMFAHVPEILRRCSALSVAMRRVNLEARGMRSSLQ